MQQEKPQGVAGETATSPILHVAIAATFTAEPIDLPLQFWLKELGLDGRIAFAPYNQLFQELLDPTSLLGCNKGVNLVLVRLEDWTRFRSEGTDENVLRDNVSELTSALHAFVARSTTPTLVWVAPPSPPVIRNPQARSLLLELEGQLHASVKGFDSLHWLGAEALDSYPVDRINDPERERIGHIPFTPLYFSALATAVARRIHVIRNSPYKVLALDCDHTLWHGVVGEDGPMGITFPPGKRALQEFAVHQQSLGMLVCLVSKNVEPDVIAVFDKRSEMALRREHLVGMRINWQPKAANLAELAAELNLGLDSFIFLDDNPVECAEMRAALPQVLTLQVPANDADIPEFLRHVWAFDRHKVTEEDRQRTLLYRQNAERNRFENQASGIHDFLAGLQLTIDIAAPKDDEWSRVAQLTQRTNQFNFTTIRRTEAEVRQLAAKGQDCLRVHVTDRFGDYGLVGVVIFGSAGDQLRIDTMLLSCRVLGRGVEHAMLARLGQAAVERGLASVTAPFVPTAKNQPAANFLEAVGLGYKQETDTGVVYCIPAGIAAQTTYQPGTGAKEALELARSDGKKVKAQGVAPGGGGDKSAFYTRLATDLRRVEMVQQAVEAFARGTRPDLETLLVEPRTKRERDLAELWARLLHLDRVGIRDDFSALGGTSLVAAQIFAEIEQRFGTRLPMTTILEAPTVEQLAERLEGDVRASLKLLRPGQKGGPALFLAHDGDGETLLYLNLARRLPEEVAVYGLEPLGSARCPCLHTRIPEMAAYYLEQIRRVRPVGPYFLAGMCAGGVIAYEMASQLLAKGERVGFVALLDAAAPRAQRRVGLITQRRGARLLQALRDKPRTNWWQRFTGRASVVVRKAWNLVVYEARTRTRWLAHRMRFRMLRSALDRGRRLPAWAERLTVRTIYELAEQEYVPGGKLDAPVTLFRATTGEGNDEPFIHRYADELFGWSAHVAGQVELIEVPGGHASMLQEPHVSTLVEHVWAGIERALPTEVAT